jgi:hypothetical protein
MSLTLKEDKTYASVLSDGRIHITVPEGTEGSRVRKYKTSDGTEGSKIELVFSEIIGKITKIDFRDGKFGTQIQLEIVDGEEKPVVLCLGTTSKFGEDVMKKLINVDMEKTVKVVPYSFPDPKDSKKKKQGVTIWQHNGTEEVKIQNYFYDPETKTNINGFPTPKELKKARTSAQWKLYFGEVNEFLIDKIKEHFKIEDKEVPTGDFGDFQ